MRPRVKISRIYFALFAVPDVYDSIPSTVYIYGKIYIYYSVREGIVKEWTKTCIYDETGAELKCMKGVPSGVAPIYIKIPVKIPVPQSTITKKITVKIYYTKEGLELVDEHSATASISRDIIYKSILPNIVSADIVPDDFVRCPGLELGEYAGKLVYSFAFYLNVRLAFPPLSDLDYKPIEVKPYICSNIGVKIHGRWIGKCYSRIWPDVVKGKTTYSKRFNVIPDPRYSEARFGYTVKYRGSHIIQIIGGRQRMSSDVRKIAIKTGLKDKLENIEIYTPTMVLTRTDSTWTYRKEPYTPPPPGKPKAKPPKKPRPGPRVADAVVNVPRVLPKGIVNIPVKIVFSKWFTGSLYIYAYINRRLFRKYRYKITGGIRQVNTYIRLDTRDLPDGEYTLRFYIFTEHEKPERIVYPIEKRKIVEKSVWTEEYTVIIGKPTKPPAPPPPVPGKPPITPPETIAISEAYIKAPSRVGVNEKFTMYLVVDLNRDITEYEVKNITVKVKVDAYKPPAVIPLISGEIKLEKPGKTYTISIDTVLKSPGRYTISGTVSLVPLGDVDVSTKPVTARSATIEVVEKPGKPPEEKPPEKPPEKRVDKKKIAAAAAIATIIGIAVAIGARK